MTLNWRNIQQTVLLLKSQIILSSSHWMRDVCRKGVSNEAVEFAYGWAMFWLDPFERLLLNSPSAECTPCRWGWGRLPACRASLPPGPAVGPGAARRTICGCPRAPCWRRARYSDWSRGELCAQRPESHLRWEIIGNTQRIRQTDFKNNRQLCEFVQQTLCSSSTQAEEKLVKWSYFRDVEGTAYKSQMCALQFRKFTAGLECNLMVE